MIVPLFELLINEQDKETGVDYVALVDIPAIERQWMAFASENKHTFKISDEEKRRVMGPLMVAGQPIYRIDDHGKPYYVIFSAETIEMIVKKFMRNGFSSNVNEMHDGNMVVENCYLIESFIVDSKRGITTPEGFDPLPDGSWFGTYQIDNDEVWQKIKAGEFKGFSVEGNFEQQPVMELEEEVLDAVIESLKQ